jgi:hypothetical protein
MFFWRRVVQEYKQEKNQKEKKPLCLFGKQSGGEI